MDETTKERLRSAAMGAAISLRDSRVADLEHDQARHLVHRTLGAIYGLLRAIDLDYQDDGTLRRDDRGRVAVEALATADASVGSAFLADFYYNAALERLTSVWDTIQERVDRRRPDTQELGCDWNTLKHDLAGLFASNRSARANEVAQRLPKIIDRVIEVAKQTASSEGERA